MAWTQLGTLSSFLSYGMFVCNTFRTCKPWYVYLNELLEVKYSTSWKYFKILIDWFSLKSSSGVCHRHLLSFAQWTHPKVQKHTHDHGWVESHDWTTSWQTPTGLYEAEVLTLGNDAEYFAQVVRSLHGRGVPSHSAHELGGKTHLKLYAHLIDLVRMSRSPLHFFFFCLLHFDL